MNITVLLIGAGGTGSYLADPLLRFLSFHFNTATIKVIVADGKSYRSHNNQRQPIGANAIGQNKAQYLTAELQRKHDNLAIIPYPHYVDYNALKTLLPNTDNAIIVNCSDSHASRNTSLKIDEFHRQFLWISPGNGLSHGQVLLYGHWNNKPVGIDPRILYADIDNPPEPLVTPGSCLERSIGTPQLISTNLLAAATTLSLLQHFFLNPHSYASQSHFDSMPPQIASF